MSKPTDYNLFVGVDISAKTASVAWGRDASQIGPAHTIRQTAAGHSGLVAQLRATGHDPAQTLVVMEATSTYWMQLASTLFEAGFVVSVINPRQARDFAQALNRRAKTDAIDAQTLAHLAATLELKAWQPPSEAWEALYQRLVERDHLIHMRQMVRNQLHALRQRARVEADVVARKQQLLDHIQQQVKTLDREVQEWLSNSEWADMAQRLRTIKGIGPLGAAWLLVVTNGFTTCENADQLTSYLGLVPHPRQSGARQRGHWPTGHSGHARARRVLYQGAISAARFNPIIKCFYDRLIARGKLIKVARVAATRKLVCLAFAVVTREQMFDPNYHSAPLALPLAA
jgi:transposase